MDGVGLRLVKPSFGDPASIDDVLHALRREVARRRPGEWIVCNPLAAEPEVFAYPQKLRERRWPTRHDLDKVSPQNPVYIEPPALVAPGFAFANSAALSACGISRDTRLPPGAEMLLDETGAPSGVFKDYNYPKVIPVVGAGFDPARSLLRALPALSQAEILRAVLAGAQAFNAAGITAIYEGHGIPPGPQRAYLDLWQTGRLTVRTYFVIAYPVSLYTDLQKGAALIDQTARYAAGDGFGDEVLRFGGLGFSFDSAAAMGACLMREDYLGPAGQRWRGVQLPSDEAFKEIVQRAARAGLRVQVQCSGGGAIDKVLALYEEVNREIPIAGKRWTIQHCQFPSAANMESCRRLGVIPT
ncbi:MAG: amidohydrolase family protein, partial [Burkholderiales bacterium]